MNKRQTGTCIAVIKGRNGKLIMAGDRRASWHFGHAEKMNRPKIAAVKDGLRLDQNENPLKSGDILLGATGNGSMCSLLVDILDVPEIQGDVQHYMFFTFREKIQRLLLNQGYGDKEKNLFIPPDSSCELVVGIKGHIYTVNVDNPYDDSIREFHSSRGGLIQIDEVSAPYATGCGGPSALPILLAEKKREKCSKKEHLQLAMEIAADISPGCDRNIDYVREE